MYTPSEYSELWRPVVNYEGLYEVSSSGKVRSLARVVGANGGGTRYISGCLLTPTPTFDGYIRVCLSINNTSRYARVHTLVLEAFIGGAPKGFECDHIDYDITNNRLENLTWLHKKDNQLKKRMFKLSIEKAANIRERALEGATVSSLAEEYSVSLNTITALLRGEHWVN